MTTRSLRSSGRRGARPAPAKLAPPAQLRLYPRERLFHRLGQLRDTPLIWLSAPAGYGKSTLVSSYLQATARSHIWYQCDAGDADIASFFYYLNMARERCSMQCSQIKVG